MGRSWFLAGIIQGSKAGIAIHDQAYRQRLTAAIEWYEPDAEVFCPFDGHHDSVNYDDARARQVFQENLERARQADMLIAYLPEASMGTAIEIWERARLGKPVWVISPLATNWIVRLFAEKRFDSLEDFERYLEAQAALQPDGGLTADKRK